MKRCLVQHGNTSLTVSLPKQWTDRHHLQKGDEVELAINEDTVVVHARHGKKHLKRGILDLSQFGVLSRRAFDALYKAGYDEIEVHYTDRKQLADIERAISVEAMTFEIVKQEKNKCIVKNISETGAEEFDALLRRTVLLLKVMGDDLLTALKMGDYETIKTIRNLEKTNNKFTHFCRRSLMVHAYRDYSKTPLLYTFVEMLEKSADEFKFLCDTLVAHAGLVVQNDVLKLFENVNRSISLFNELFSRFDISKAQAYALLHKKIVVEGYALFEKKKDSQIIIIHHLITIENRVFNMFGPYLATVL